MPDSSSAIVTPAKDGRGGFFAVDRRAWHFTCNLGLNGAAEAERKPGVYKPQAGEGGISKPAKVKVTISLLGAAAEDYVVVTQCDIRPEP